MSAKTSLSGLCGILLITLSACVGGSAEMIREQERQVMDLRRQVDQLKLQMKGKDEETKRLAEQLEKAKKMEAQVISLEDRLKMMDDLVMTKSEEIARLEGQLDAVKEAAAAKEAPVKKAKPEAGAKDKQAP